MKIAFYHELHKGGARIGTNEFAKQLKKKHQVDLYTIDNLIEEEKKYYSKIYSFNFSAKKWAGNNWKIRLYKDTVELLKLFWLNKKIATEINSRNYDLVYITASQYIESPFLLNLVNKTKFYYLNDPYYRMIYESSLFKPKRKDFVRKYYEIINRFIRKNIDLINIHQVNFILAASDFTLKQFKKIYKMSGITTYYGVDTKFFTNTNKERDIDLLFIGSRNILDGYQLFQEILKNSNQKLNVRTILFEEEWKSAEELRDIYRRTKILIATSFNEPLGLIPLEAMSCGAIVLAVDEAGYKETVIDRKTGYLLKRDSTLFVSKINYLLKNNKVLLQMSKNAVTNMTNWTWEERGQKLEKIISSKMHGI